MNASRSGQRAVVRECWRRFCDTETADPLVEGFCEVITQCDPPVTVRDVIRAACECAGRGDGRYPSVPMVWNPWDQDLLDVLAAWLYHQAFPEGDRETEIVMAFTDGVREVVRAMCVTPGGVSRTC